MIHHRHFAAALVLVALGSEAAAEIRLIGKGAIPADAADKSGVNGILEDGTRLNTLGSCGSGIAHTGVGQRYVLVSDRGPKDGAAAFPCRFHVMDLTLDGAGGLKWDLIETRLLTDAQGRSFIGLASELRPGKTAGRLDPEAVRVSPSGTILIADEYGPHLMEFSAEGRLIREFSLPKHLRIAHPHADAAKELADNKSGRVPNRGMEGLAITPDGSKLLGAMQSPLIQDGGTRGTNLRLVEIDLASGATREFLYALEHAKMAVSEILAVNDHEFLVLERTGSSDAAGSRTARIFKIDISRATDISRYPSLPRDTIPSDVVPVNKSPFIDLLDPAFGLAGPDFPTKVEGLAFGPDLPDGRRLLLVTSDNDCSAEPMHIWAFAIESRDLPHFQPQSFRSR